MIEQDLSEEFPEDSDKKPGSVNEGSGEGDSTEAEAEAEEKELTPEEQMAQYEESLKDEDWGHQPC